MDRRKLWLKCDCVEHDPNIEGPFNCEVNVARLRHVKTTRQHDEQCPLFRLKKSKDADNTITEGKTSPLNPVGGNDWLPDKKKDNKINAVEGPVVPRKRRPRKSSLPTLKPLKTWKTRLKTITKKTRLKKSKLLKRKPTLPPLRPIRLSKENGLTAGERNPGAAYKKAG